jgi:hypothetical protein
VDEGSKIPSDFRRSMNLKIMKMKGLKIHDFHIIMEMLMPIMFCGYVPMLCGKR